MSTIANIGPYEIEDTKARNDIKVLNTFIKPEQFGAVGDGITDDSQAFINMIAYVDSIVPMKEYINESSCKDYSKIQFQFSRRYAISKPINFVNTYGVVLNNLKLIATEDFVGEYLIGFSNVNRQINLENCYLDGNLKANKCLSVVDYTLGFKIVNGEITRFKTHGLYFGENKGHETIISNTKINQVEWGEKDSLGSLVTNGIGLYLDTERYDNHFNNIIINYCKDNTMVIKSGANYFNQCHFYGKEVLIEGSYNYINNCYFDTTPLHMNGFTYLKGCNFSGRSDYFIKIIEDVSQRYKYEHSYITDCIFSCPESSGMTTPIIFNESWVDTSLFKIECINNSFYQVSPFNYQSYHGINPAPWKANKGTGNGDNGTCRIGNFLIQWGTITQEDAASGYIFFPKEYDGYLIDVILTPQYTETDGVPYANDMNNQRFWANGVHGTCKWIAIGVVNW